MKGLLLPLTGLVLLPEIAGAQTLSSVAGVFNIFVGLMLVAAFLLFFGGLVLWAIRLGTYPTHRDAAIGYMKWAVAILFVLVVLLAVVQFVQTHTAFAATVLGFIVAGLVAWGIFSIASTPADTPAEKEEH